MSDPRRTGRYSGPRVSFAALSSAHPSGLVERDAVPLAGAARDSR
jgi:hypothetical protein